MLDKLKMECVEFVSKSSKFLTEYSCGEFFRLNYNMDTGVAWVNFMKLSEKNHFCIYPDGNVLNCGDITKPLTKNQVVQMIKDAVKSYEEILSI